MSNYLKDLEDSRLLFKTFCGGLMYGMFFYHGENLHRVTSIEGLDETVNGVYPIKECRPCLRPMSSMTEEEKKEVCSLNGMSLIELNERLKWDIYVKVYTIETFDYFNTEHLDYRGLIKKGLAIEEPEGLYKLKNNYYEIQNT